jgi:hypothetical protein
MLPKSDPRWNSWTAFFVEVSGHKLSLPRLEFWSGRIIFLCMSSTLLHLPPPQIPLCWRTLGSNSGQLRLRHWLSEALATRLHLIDKSATSHPQFGYISSTARLHLIRQISTCRKVPWQVNFFYDDILHCLLWVLSFYKYMVHGGAGQLQRFLDILIWVTFFLTT